MLDQFALFGLILAMAMLWIFNFMMIRKVQRHETTWKELKVWQSWIERKMKRSEKIAKQTLEQRCQHCQEGPECPGYNTGVIYPCEYYKEREEHGDKKQHPQHPIFGRAGRADRPADRQDIHRKI